MYARLATYRAPEAGPDLTDADYNQFVELLTGQSGCRGAWALAEEGEGAGDGLFFSLWETREQAEAAGDNARQGTMRILESRGVTELAPPEVRVLTVVAPTG